MGKRFLNLRRFKTKQRNVYENQAHNSNIFMLRRKFCIFTHCYACNACKILAF